MNLRSEATDRLFSCILSLESVDECYAFFEDLCTVKELQDMSQRLSTAVLLSDGLSYSEISKKADISSATIGRVSRCLNYGSGGYSAAIKKLKEKEGLK